MAGLCLTDTVSGKSLANRQKKPQHVAIIGCGFTGTTTLYQLVKKYPVKRITVFDTSGVFGPGFPYQAGESREYLLNNTNDTMCLEPSNRQAFVEWLREHPGYSVNLDEKTSMPRFVYGEFLEDVINRTVTEASARGVRVEFVPEEVIDLEQYDSANITVKTRSGSYGADIAVLATGRCPDIDMLDLPDGPGLTYVRQHIPGQLLDTLPADGRIHVLGASLSAYDVVNQLFAPSTECEFIRDRDNRLRYVANGNDRQVVLCSRSGRLKKVQSRHRYPVVPSETTFQSALKLGKGQATLKQLYELMEDDAERNGVHIDRQEILDPYFDCETLVDLNRRAAENLSSDIDAASASAGSKENFVVEYLDAIQMIIWDVFASQVLAPEQEALYRSRFETAFLSHAAPCPSSTAQKILALMQSGNLTILNGVSAVRIADDMYSYRIDHQFGTDECHVLINASGIVDRKATSERQSSLIANLVRKGLLKPYRPAGTEANGLAVNMNSFQSEGASNVYVANMFLWGPGFYVSSAIMMATIVERLLQYAFGD